MGAARHLLLECLLAAAEPRPAIPALAASVRPGRFVTLARRWAVAETAAQVLLAAGALEALGARWAGALRADLENASAKNSLLLSESARLQAALREAGVDSVALKGAALVAAHYPAVGARHVGDLDLLVHRRDAQRAASVLGAMGCAPAGPPLPGLDGRPAPAVRPDRHHLPLLWTPGGVACELHYALPGAPGRVASAEGVLARARDVRWGGAPLRIPCLDDLLGMACTHALGAHRNERLFLPRHLADVAVLLSAGADAERAGLLHAGPEIAGSLRLVAQARAGHASALLPLGGAWPPLVRGRAVLSATWKAWRTGELRRVLFPARAYLASRYGVAPRSPWVPLLWIWRPIRALLRIGVGR